MKAFVNRELCIGCGLCVATCPSVFELDDESLSRTITTDVPKELEQSCNEAAENCPVGAIIVE